MEEDIDAWRHSWLVKQSLQPGKSAGNPRSPVKKGIICQLTAYSGIGVSVNNILSLLMFNYILLRLKLLSNYNCYGLGTF